MNYIWTTEFATEFGNLTAGRVGFQNIEYNVSFVISKCRYNKNTNLYQINLECFKNNSALWKHGSKSSQLIKT